ncbi:hypothetical protein FW778_00805 [Ginsengibacter hankyongi]|uniref:Uncharacterized protein n=1 Tax=Ginsengibacter hankyongi TaxID=2607284 RepID=A0A5J5IL69_9BACT|nr:hypothetical protein [Ginsengibacter hankyongi]KAA9040614.1 hypothetical protein FW778_00805 [Ginsengibacter hankyongi]
MSTNISQKESTAFGALNTEPSVFIIMPFEPMMSTKYQLELKLKQVSKIVEEKLLKNHIAAEAQPILLRLQLLIKELNYNSLKKSIAILLSASDEQVIYFDIPVREKVSVDESFGICDIILNKKEKIGYLVLLLNSDKSKMYVGNLKDLQLIKSNKSSDFPWDKNDIPQRVANFSDPGDRKEILLHKFLRHMDQGLSLILRAYNLPVFIIAPERVLGHFKKITRNEEKLVAEIHGDYLDSSETTIFKILQPHLQNWKKLKQQYILQEIEKARNEHILACGIKDVYNTATYKNSRLLVIEKDLITSKNTLEVDQYISRHSTPFYIKSTLDGIIEKVIKYGGNVEVVDKLQANEQIALIPYY